MIGYSDGRQFESELDSLLDQMEKEAPPVTMTFEDAVPRKGRGGGSEEPIHFPTMNEFITEGENDMGKYDRSYDIHQEEPPYEFLGQIGLNISPSAWEKFIKETPKSENIQDNRSKGPAKITLKELEEELKRNEDGYQTGLMERLEKFVKGYWTWKFPGTSWGKYDKDIDSAVETDKQELKVRPALTELARRSDWWSDIERQLQGEAGKRPPKELVEEFKTLKESATRSRFYR